MQHILNNKEKFITRIYTDKVETQPDFLTTTDYYFSKQDTNHLTDEALDAISDSEVLSKTTAEELEAKQHEKTDKFLSTMLN